MTQYRLDIDQPTFTTSKLSSSLRKTVNIQHQLLSPGGAIHDSLPIAPLHCRAPFGQYCFARSSNPHLYSSICKFFTHLSRRRANNFCDLWQPILQLWQPLKTWQSDKKTLTANFVTPPSVAHRLVNHKGDCLPKNNCLGLLCTCTATQITAQKYNLIIGCLRVDRTLDDYYSFQGNLC